MNSRHGDQTRVPCVVMRGGTSKGLFFHERNVPAPGTARDAFLKRVMGTPDVIQIDGLGGSRLVTSKAVLVNKSERTDADVDYTFVQVDVQVDMVSYDSNCGNLSAAVGPFAIDEGLIQVEEPLTTVRIFNTNTGKVLNARVPTSGGVACVTGDCAIAGVPGTGAEILIDYMQSIGSKTGSLLPTTHARDEIELESGEVVEVSLVDAATPCIFVAATTFGLTGSELPHELVAQPELSHKIEELQAKAGERMGMWENWRKVRAPLIPLFAIVAPAHEYVDGKGETHSASSMDLRVRQFTLGNWHDSMSGTGAICLAAASRVPGTVVSRVLTKDSDWATLRIGHPLGVMTVRASAMRDENEVESVRITELGLIRTARRLMSGEVYVPAEFFPSTD